VSRGISACKAETSRETADVNTSLSAVLDRTTSLNVAGWEYDKIADFALDESHILESFLYCDLAKAMY
jgi:hypothetical protein